MDNLSSWKIWIMAARPKTLPAAVSPILLGTSMAFGDGLWHPPSAVLCLITALLFQIGTNFANDYYDWAKGADTADRVGPTRVTQAGLMKPETLKSAMVLVFACSALTALGLIIRGGWPFALLTGLAIAAGVLYTAGSHPLGYRGWGDVLVLFFFGPVAVAGTYAVQALEYHGAVFGLGLGAGLISTAILVVNNLRDVDTDRAAGKKTLAVRFGTTFARWEYSLCLVTALVIPLALYVKIQDHIGLLGVGILFYAAVPLLATLWNPNAEPGRLNRLLAQSAFLLLLYCALLSAAWILT